MSERRDDLIRMTTTPVEVRRDDTGEWQPRLVGYPIRFNEWTHIKGWEGDFFERIAPGALTKTLNERGEQIKVLFNHGMDPSIGNKPLGKPDVLRTDDTGLWAETPLADTSYNRDLMALIDAGAIDGQSFRFSVVREDEDRYPEASEWNPRGLPQRTVVELRLVEFGPVTFPAYQATSIGIRARAAYEMYLGDAARRGTSPLPEDATPPDAGTLQHDTIAARLRAIDLTLKGA